MKTLVVVPTYNEADNIANFSAAILALSVPLDVLIVDDASPDGTGQIADRLVAESDRVHVLHRTGLRGLGRAYVDGFGGPSSAVTIASSRWMRIFRIRRIICRRCWRSLKRAMWWWGRGM